jgi:hypothetical protein
MEELAGWVAPIATMIAAMMTAANLGPRITGWGFVVFTIGSVAWVTIALSTHQSNLLLANGFLTFVNLIGIWRWLGRQARFQEGGKRAEKQSKRTHSPELFPLSSINGMPVDDNEEEHLGHCIDAMAECASGRIGYVVVSEKAGVPISERLHAVNWSDVAIQDGRMRLPISKAALEALPMVPADSWPVNAPRLAENSR